MRILNLEIICTKQTFLQKNKIFLCFLEEIIKYNNLGLVACCCHAWITFMINTKCLSVIHWKLIEKKIIVQTVNMSKTVSSLHNASKTIHFLYSKSTLLKRRKGRVKVRCWKTWYISCSIIYTNIRYQTVFFIFYFSFASFQTN